MGITGVMEEEPTAVWLRSSAYAGRISSTTLDGQPEVRFQAGQDADANADADADADALLLLTSVATCGFISGNAGECSHTQTTSHPIRRKI